MAEAAKKQEDSVSFETIKLTIEKADFVKSLARLQSIVERRNTIPVLANIKIDATQDGVKLTATDMDISASENTAAKVETEGAITIPAHITYDIIRKLPEGSQIQLDFDIARSNQLKLKSGNSKFNLPVLPASDFPDMAIGKMDNSFSLSASDLIHLIDKTKFAISTEETRYYLNGIYFHVQESDGKQVLRAVATDGHRLAMMEINQPEGAASMPGVIMPRKTVYELRKLLDGIKDEVKVRVSKTKIKFECGTSVITSKLIDGTYPDYGKVIPKGNDKTLEIDAKALAEAVDRASTIVTESKAVRLNAADGKMTISATNSESGQATETLDAKYSSDQIEIGFNFRYVLDVMNEFDGDTVQLQLSEPSAPVIIRDPSDVSSLFVIMPLRV